jgi:hypothetical protein
MARLSPTKNRKALARSDMGLSEVRGRLQCATSARRVSPGLVRGELTATCANAGVTVLLPS